MDFDICDSHINFITFFKLSHFYRANCCIVKKNVRLSSSFLHEIKMREIQKQKRLKSLEIIFMIKKRRSDILTNSPPLHFRWGDFEEWGRNLGQFSDGNE